MKPTLTALGGRALVQLDALHSLQTTSKRYNLEVLTTLTREELLELADQIKVTFGPPAQPPAGA